MSYSSLQLHNLVEDWCQISLQFKLFIQYFFFLLVFLTFLGPIPRHMEIPRLGVKSGLQPPAYARATATRDPSRVCNLHHRSRQRRILNPLSKGRDRTRNLMVSSRICQPLRHDGNSHLVCFKTFKTRYYIFVLFLSASEILDVSVVNCDIFIWWLEYYQLLSQSQNLSNKYIYFYDSCCLISKLRIIKLDVVFLISRFCNVLDSNRQD